MWLILSDEVRKKLEKYGKVVKINASKLFSTKDTLF